MRMIWILFLASFGVFSSAYADPAFKEGQVWRLEADAFANALVTIGKIESRGDQSVLHVSISGLPGPRTDSPLFSAIFREMQGTSGYSEPLHYLASGISGEPWSSLAADITFSANWPNSTVSVPYVAVLEDDLINAIAGPVPVSPDLHSMFDDLLELWLTNERRWPELNDAELNQPISLRLERLLRGVNDTVSDASTVNHIGPRPPAIAGPDETRIDNPVLDADCRNIVSPKPLSPALVSKLLEVGFTPQEIPVIDVTVSEVSMTRSDLWGQIWRADVRDNRAPSTDHVSRAVCWKISGEFGPAVAMYPVNIDEE